jgi:hypothetical protein
MNPERLEQFREVYTAALTKAVLEHPSEYYWPVEQVPEVVGRMMKAIETNSYSHNSRAFKTTCKALGIAHTRKAILNYLIAQ